MIRIAAYLAALALALALCTAAIASAPQNNVATTITIQAPSAGATYTSRGALSVVATATGALAGPLVATIRQAGVFDPVLPPQTLLASADGRYATIFPLPAVTVLTDYSLTITDGVATAVQAFKVAPASATDPTTPPSATLQQVVSLINGMVLQQDADTKLLLAKVAALNVAVKPDPAPQGFKSEVVSATTLYADGNFYKVTIKVPKEIGPPPAKGSTVTVVGASTAR